MFSNGLCLTVQLEKRETINKGIMLKAQGLNMTFELREEK